MENCPIIEYFYYFNAFVNEQNAAEEARKKANEQTTNIDG